MKVKRKVSKRLRNIRLLAMDFDGVHTDGYVDFRQDGVESVKCSRKDGLGLNMLASAGIHLAVISKETNPVVEARCKKLRVEPYHGVESGGGKRDILASLVEREGILPKESVFIGDDVNDIAAIEFAGVGVTVADGHPLVKEVADIVLTRKGGKHALRQLAELILKAKGIPIAF